MKRKDAHGQIQMLMLAPKRRRGSRQLRKKVYQKPTTRTAMIILVFRCENR